MAGPDKHLVEEPSLVTILSQFLRLLGVALFGVQHVIGKALQIRHPGWIKHISHTDDAVAGKGFGVFG